VSLFSSGLIPAGTVIEVNVVDAPQELYYYEAQWYGLTFCMLGIWLPHAKTTKGSLRRTPGVRPVPSGPGGGGYPYPYGTFVVDGDGNFVDMGDGTLVIE
jgi:hypothetical protein